MAFIDTLNVTYSMTLMGKYNMACHLYFMYSKKLFNILMTFFSAGFINLDVLNTIQINSKYIGMFKF